MKITQADVKVLLKASRFQSSVNAKRGVEVVKTIPDLCNRIIAIYDGVTLSEEQPRIQVPDHGWFYFEASTYWRASQAEKLNVVNKELRYYVIKSEEFTNSVAPFRYLAGYDPAHVGVYNYGVLFSDVPYEGVAPQVWSENNFKTLAVQKYYPELLIRVEEAFKRMVERTVGSLSFEP